MRHNLLVNIQLRTESLKHLCKYKSEKTMKIEFCRLQALYRWGDKRIRASVLLINRT
jgi:hypothetical protein